MYLAGSCCDSCTDSRAGLAGYLGLDLPSIDSGDEDLGAVSSDLVTQYSGAIPVAGPFVQGALQFGAALARLLKIGAGRKEADIIVNDPQSGQNLLMQKLGVITDAFRTGTNPSMQELQQMWLAVWTMAQVFERFVLSPMFKDRRASGQALNTVMPYIDGTCGYAVPLGGAATPTQQNCLSWGDGTLGGVGTNGMLGALTRAIIARGGAIPTPGINQGVGANYPTLQSVPLGVPNLPQAGTIPATYQPGSLQYAGIVPVGGLSSSTLLALGGLALLAFKFGRR